MILKRRALLGFGPSDDHHITILNRMIDMVVENGENTILYKPDPRHVDLLVKQFGLNDLRAKGVGTPGEKKGDYHDEEPLSKSDGTLYRSGTMRLAYLAEDLANVKFCGNRAARSMSSPTRGAWNRLKRAVRYLKDHPRWVQRFVEQEFVKTIDCFTDSDWASDIKDRKSVSCIVVMIGRNTIKVQVSTQTAPALSSGEAEYVANVKGG